MSSDKLDLFHIRLNGKNYSAWEFPFQLFVKGKELWGHINGSNPAPTDVDALSRWEIMDARVMTWILSSIEPHLVLNLRPYKTAAAMWNYLNKVYNQDNTARRFQLEYEMANFTQGSLLRNTFPVFKIFGLIIQILFMLMFLLQLSLLFKQCTTQAREINS